MRLRHDSLTQGIETLDANPHHRQRAASSGPDALPTDCEVAVVGGGPAGACAAHALASQGIDVVLLEREMLPRYKVCGGGLVNRVHRFLPVDATPVIERRCRDAELNLLPRGLHYIAQRRQAVVSMTMRADFDWLLVDAARQAGARIVYPCEVLDVADQGDHVELATPAGKLHARFVVAADGAGGRLARYGGWQEHRNNAPALEYEVTVPPEVLEQFSHTARFDIGAVAHGYGWVFPKREHLSVGIGVLGRGRSGARALKGTLQDYLAAIGVAPLRSVQRHGYVIPLAPRKSPLVRGRVILVGDSAGVADPLTGEGISNAVISGRLAGEALVAGALDPATVARHYSRRLDEMILRELRASRMLARLLYDAPALAARLLQRNDARLTERIVDVFMGDTTCADVVGHRLGFIRTALRV